MENKKIKPWVLWVLVGLIICSSISYMSYITIYTPVMNWLGFPTRAQIDELFIFAEKIGYLPQNQLAFNPRACSGLFAENCQIILIFKVNQTIQNLLDTQSDQITVLESIEGTSRSSNLIGGFRSAGATLLLDGKSSLDVPSPPDFPRISWVTHDKHTNVEWGFTLYLAQNYTESVEVDGENLMEDFVILRKTIK